MSNTITQSTQLIRFAIDSDAAARDQHSKRALLSYHTDIKNECQAHRAAPAVSTVATVKQSVRSAMRYESFEWASFVRRALHTTELTGQAYVFISGGFISAYAHGQRLFIEAIDAYTPDAAINCANWLINNVGKMMPLEENAKPLFAAEDEQTVVMSAIEAVRNSPYIARFTDNNLDIKVAQFVEDVVLQACVALHEMNAYGIDIRPNELRNADRIADAAVYIIENDITDMPIVGTVFANFLFMRSAQALAAPRAVAVGLDKVFTSFFAN